MAHILLQCGDCGKHLAADEKDTKPVSCPDCKKELPAPASLHPFSCPSCHQAFKIANNLAGQRIQCPGCQSPIVLPPKFRPGVKRLSLHPEQEEEDDVSKELDKLLADEPRAEAPARQGVRWIRWLTILVVASLLVSAGFVFLKQKRIEKDFEAACAFALQHPTDYDGAIVQFQEIAQRATKFRIPRLRALAEEQIQFVHAREEQAKTVRTAEGAYQKGIAELKEVGLVDGNVDAAKWLTAASEKGHTEAQFRVGEIYRTGNGVPLDTTKAVHWLGEAAEHGHALAQSRLGEIYLEGEGVAKDPAKARQWFQRAADQSDVGAYYHLGRMHAEGAGMDRDTKVAAEWFRKAADRGDRRAQSALGTMCLRGEGVAKDESQAMRWFTVAAEQGEPAAQYTIGRAYLDGTGVAQDKDKGLDWVRKAANLGHAAAQNDFGMMLLQGQVIPQNQPLAAQWFAKAAEQGEAVAQYNLGTMFLEGTGIRASPERAAELFLKAAGQGNALAQTRLGVMYHLGTGVLRDDTEAVRWLTLACEQGEHNAEYSFSQIYFETNSPLHDPGKALSWLRRAAEGGHAQAQADLGLVCDLGQGVKQDWVEAMRWYERAAEQGVVTAQYRLSELYAIGPESRRDPSKRVQWLAKAAEQRHAAAQRDLGICYLQGNGVTKDLGLARSWLEKAADQEDAIAQYHLGRIYYEGLGVAPRLATAGRWLTRSAEQGNRDALKLLKEQRQKEIEKMPGGVAVTLHSGPVVKGVLISETQDQLVVETAYFDRTILTTTTIPKSDAKSIAHETIDEKDQRVAYESLLLYRLHPSQAYPVSYYRQAIARFEKYARDYPESYYTPQVRRWIADWTAELKLAGQGRVKIAERWLSAEEADDIVRYRGQWLIVEEAVTSYQREVEVEKRQTQDIRERLRSQREAETRRNTVMYEVDYHSSKSWRGNSSYSRTFMVGKGKNSEHGRFDTSGLDRFVQEKAEFDQYGLLARYSSHAEAKEARRRRMEADRTSPDPTGNNTLARYEIRLNPSDGGWYLYRLGAAP